MSSSEEDGESVGPEPSTEPIRVAEVLLATYQWDAWVAAATDAGRRAKIVATFTGVIAVIIAAAGGFAYIPGAGRISAVVYAPIVGWVIRQWLIRVVSEHRVRQVLAEVRSVVVPALVERIDDGELRRLVTRGGVLMSGLSTVIASDRRDSAVALTASEYDLTGFPYMLGSAGTGGP